jgi:hypothetical protein
MGTGIGMDAGVARAALAHVGGLRTAPGPRVDPEHRLRNDCGHAHLGRDSGDDRVLANLARWGDRHPDRDRRPSIGPPTKINLVLGLSIGIAQTPVLRSTIRWRKASPWWPLVLATALTAGDLPMVGLGSIALSDRFEFAQPVLLRDGMPYGIWRVGTAALSGGIAGVFLASFLVATTSAPYASMRRVAGIWAAALAVGNGGMELILRVESALLSPPDIWPRGVTIVYSIVRFGLTAVAGGAVLGSATGLALVAPLASAQAATRHVRRFRSVRRRDRTSSVRAAL